MKITVSKTTWTMIACVIVMLVATNFLINRILRKTEFIQSEYKQHIGKTIVMDSDTLEIVDYSTILDQYTLSNNSKVSRKYVETKIKSK